jgi:hypothetical protein
MDHRDDDTRAPVRARRGFLFGAGAAGAAAAVAAGAAAVAPVAPAAAPVAAVGDEATRGYRLTEHVRRYYRTTTI